LRVDAEDRPGRAGGKVDLGVFRTAGTNLNLKRGSLAACAINPASCGAVFASFIRLPSEAKIAPHRVTATANARAALERARAFVHTYVRMSFLNVAHPESS
jgi:hypothetical protein